MIVTMQWLPQPGQRFASLKRKGGKAIRCDKGRGVAGRVAVPCDESNSVSAHESCHVRADDCAAKKFFQRAENGVIIKSAALHYDFLPNSEASRRRITLYSAFLMTE